MASDEDIENFSRRRREEDEMIKNELQSSAIRGKWGEVVAIYQENPIWAHKFPITRSGDTALHLAISAGQEEVVERLVRCIKNHSVEALWIQNDMGNTPLHLAASLGNVAMCWCIADADSQLIGARNRDFETPFFLTVLHNRKVAFLCFHELRKRSDYGVYTYCRRLNGDTILHAAIDREYFDLAFQISHRYQDLVNSVNEQGASPLHLLASKRSAFRSCSPVRGFFNNLFYLGINVDELQVDKEFHSDLSRLRGPDYQKGADFFHVLKNFIRGIFGCHGTNGNHLQKPEVSEDIEQQFQPHESRKFRAQGHELFPPNYATCFIAFKIIFTWILLIFRLGSIDIVKLQEKKEKHKWSVQVMNELLARISILEDIEDYGRKPTRLYDQLDGGGPIDYPYPWIEPRSSEDDQHARLAYDNLRVTSQGEDEEKGRRRMKISNLETMEKRVTPILMAAKNGVVEMVKRILELDPKRINDMNWEKKNIALLAVEYRQPLLYAYLLGRADRHVIFGRVDENGNNALHLAAKLQENPPWRMKGAALQMQMEIKWYEFVKNSLPINYLAHYLNRDAKTPSQIFSESHLSLARDGSKWLISNSSSCSFVATLIATVAFATSTTVPGGVKQDSGTPILGNEPAFIISAISSLMALCFSITSVVMFLSILTSSFEEKDFRKDLPRKLLVGMTSLFVSMASMVISFCAGHLFVLRDELKNAAYPVYALICLPVIIFAVAQFPLDCDTVRAILKKVPQQWSRK